MVLGWGVELSAPDVFFPDALAADAAIFDIKAVSAGDTVGYASIIGTTGQPVSIGYDEFLAQSLAQSAVKVESGSTLYLANASVNGSANNTTTAITVAAGSSLVLAQDPVGGGHRNRSPSAIPSTIRITNGWNGIVCVAGRTSGCTISDATLKAGVSSVVIVGQENQDIDAEDFANISLTSAPIIGLPPADAGFQQCIDKPDVANSSPRQRRGGVAQQLRRA